jgi:hypothetical protein
LTVNVLEPAALARLAMLARVTTAMALNANEVCFMMSNCKSSM